MDESVKQLLKSPHEPDRRKAIGLLCRKPDRETIIALQQVAEIDESLEVRFYARRALATVKTLRKPKTDNPLLMLLPEVLDTGTFLRFDDDEKCTVIKALIEQNRANSLPCFLELLPLEQNPRVLAAMISAVGVFGGIAESRALIPFLSHKDARVRANSIEALELLGNLKLFAYIFPLLEDTDNRVRANAARSLRSIEPFTSFRLLQAMISSGRTPFQASALYVLRHFISDASAALVIPFLDSQQDDLRLRARQTIRKLAAKGVARAIELAATLPAECEEPQEPEFKELDTTACSVDECVARLSQAFKIVDARNRLEAVEKESLQLGDKAVMPLIEHLEHEADPLIIGKIYILLGRLYDQRALPCLIKGLRRLDDRCRANAVEAIGMLGETVGLQHLVPSLKDPHNRVRGNAILALQKLEGVDITAPLASLVESSEEFYQRTAVYVLAELQRPELFYFLKRLQKSEFVTVRKNTQIAIAALERAGCKITSDQSEVEQNSVESSEDENTNVTDSIAAAEPSQDLSENTNEESSEVSHVSEIVDKPVSFVKIPPRNAADEKNSGSSWWRYLVILGIVGAFVAIISLIRISIDVSGDRAAKDILLAATLAHAQDTSEKGLEIVAGLSLLETQANNSHQALNQHISSVEHGVSILERFAEAISDADASAADVVQVYQILQQAGKTLSQHCQNLVRIIETAQKRAKGSSQPLTGLVSAEGSHDDLVALVAMRNQFAVAEDSSAKLPTVVSRSRSSLPNEASITREYEKFVALSKILPEKQELLNLLQERIELVGKESMRVAEVKETLIKVSSGHDMVTRLSDLHRSLTIGLERLTACRDALASSTQIAEKIVPAQPEPDMLANLKRAATNISHAEKSLPDLAKIPSLLRKAQARIVKVIAVLHQKVFAETVMLGREAEDSADWEEAVRREARKIAGLYASAHALNDTVTSENARYFPDIELSTLADDLKASSASAAAATLYLNNAGSELDSFVAADSRQDTLLPDQSE